MSGRDPRPHLDPFNHEPEPAPSVVAEWKGSTLAVYGLEDIARQAVIVEKAMIFHEDSFDHPIDKVSITAHSDHGQLGQFVGFTTRIKLDPAIALEVEDLQVIINHGLALDVGDSVQESPVFPFVVRPHKNQTTNFVISNEEWEDTYSFYLDRISREIVLSVGKEHGMSSPSDVDEVLSGRYDRFGLGKRVKAFLSASAMVIDFINRPDATEDVGLGANQASTKRYYHIEAGAPKELVKSPRGTRRDMGAAAVRRKLVEDLVDFVPETPPELLVQGENMHLTQHPTTEISWSDDGIEYVGRENLLTLEDIGGLREVKRQLEDIATSFNHPKTMKKWGAKRPQGILLYGPPGTGKTMLAKALAHEIQAEVMSIQSSDVYEKWLGDSEQRIKDIFSKIKQAKTPTILLFDEIESIIGISDKPSTGGADNARNAVAGIFKQEMNTLSEDNPNVIVVGITNDKDRIDSSLIRSGRFDRTIYVPMPDEESRKEILINIVQKMAAKGRWDYDFAIFDDDLDLPKLAQKTAGLSGADIGQIFERAKFAKAIEDARSDGTEILRITQTDIIDQLDSLLRDR